MDGSDKTFHFAYDERWRVVATYRESDANPKEQFIYHCTGADGQGGSSYIDAVILRDQDANSNWVTTAADGVLEKRDFYCQNWRADVVALITASGGMGGWVKYSAYGIPYGIPAGDTNGDGVVNSTDSTNATSWAGTGAGATHPTADINLDGDINSTDQTAIGVSRSGVSLGWGKLSEASATSGGAAGGNRKGYAGYEFDPVLIDSNWHVRHRVLNSDLGRWIRRDPLKRDDDKSRYEYIHSDPSSATDPSGLTPTDQWGCSGWVTTICWSDPFWGPQLQELRHEIIQSCGAMPPVLCRNSCRLRAWITPSCGFWGPSLTINICEHGIPANDSSTGYCGALYHEMIHAKQACDAGLFNRPCKEFAANWLDPDNCIRREYTAYTLAGQCGSAEHCCERACQSCITVDIYHGTPADCVTRCKCIFQIP